MAAAESLDANYARAGYHARQRWGRRPALILIDFAQAYFDPASPLFGGEGCQMVKRVGLIDGIFAGVSAPQAT